jgi:hypothetical protein
MNKGCLKSGLTALLGGMTLMAWAADPVAVLQQPQGKVFVSQGKVMAPVQQSLPLYAGNRVIVASGGRAEIAYPDGCVVALPENSLLAVKGADQCRLSQAQVRATGGFQNARIGQAGPLSSGGSNNGAIADLKRPQGSVLVDQGAAEKPGAHNMSVRREDQIVTSKESKVTVVFRGCEVEVGPEEQVTVDQLRARCKDGVVLESGAEAGSEIAIVKQPLGAVMVDNAPARNDMGLQGNNRIITGAGSKVMVIFKGCEVVVDEKEQVVVRNLVTQCKGGLWVDAGGAAGGAVGTVGTGTLIVGSALGGSIIGAILANGREDRAASPATNPAAN